MNVLGYIIVAARDDGTRWYMGIDRASGGYEYFTAHAPSAEVYQHEEDARIWLAKRQSVTFYHNASGANYEHPRRTVVIQIERISSEPVGESTHHTFTVPAPGDRHVLPLLR